MNRKSWIGVMGCLSFAVIVISSSHRKGPKWSSGVAKKIRNLTTLPCDMQNLFDWLKIYCFLPNCFPPNDDGSENSRCMTLMALKKNRLWRLTSRNLNVRQATSQQVFKVTTFYMETRFQSFSPSIDRIVHYALLKFSPCLNKPPPQLNADWYSKHTLIHHVPDAVIYRISIRTAGWLHVRTDELGCHTTQKRDCKAIAMCWCNVLKEHL